MAPICHAIAPAWQGRRLCQENSFMPTSHADVSTEHASHYLQQLCKHWAHKFPIEFDPNHGVIDLSLGLLCPRPYFIDQPQENFWGIVSVEKAFQHLNLLALLEIMAVENGYQLLVSSGGI